MKTDSGKFRAKQRFQDALNELIDDHLKAGMPADWIMDVLGNERLDGLEARQRELFERAK